MKQPIHQAPEGLYMGAIILVAIATTLVFGLGVLAAWWLTPTSLIAAPSPAFRRDVAGFERSLLEDPPEAAVDEASARARLASRAIDVEAGLARVPIREAMGLVAIGCRPPGAGEAALRPARPACPPPSAGSDVGSELAPPGEEGR